MLWWWQKEDKLYLFVNITFAFFLSMLSPLILIHEYFFNASIGFKGEIITIIIKRMLLSFGRRGKKRKAYLSKKKR